MPYIGVSPFNGVRKKHTYTATASQTSFSGAGTEGITLSYKDSTFVDVFQNGVKLGEADYTSTSGTAIVLAQGASVNDLIEVVVYDVFSVADTVSKADGGTFDGNVTMGGTLDVTGDATFDTSTLKVDSSNNRVGIGTASPDKLLTVQSSGTTTAKIDTSSSSSYAELLIEDGNAGYALQTRSDNPQSTANGSFLINDVDTGSFPVVINEGNATNTLVLKSNKVGIGVADPAEVLDVAGKVQATGDFDGVGLDLDASAINFNVNQTANNLTASFIGAGLGTMELQGTSSGGFIDIKQGDNDYDVRFGGNNSGGYIANNSASFSISGTSGFTATIVGALSKSSGSFKISHPLESKKDTHHLFHSFVEGPQCDNLYRGKIELSNGSATVNLDTKSGMTDGTFVALNRDIQCFTTNETGWTAIKGSVSGNVLTITAQDNSCTDTISWLVIGERQDDEIKASSLTDDDGNLVVEKLKSEAPDANQNYGNL